VAKPVPIEVKIRSKRQEDGSLLLRMLITHPMENGRRRDTASGKPVRAHYIQEVTVLRNDKVVARCLTGPGISRDPYFALKLLGGEPGDRLRVEWRDNRGGSGNATTVSE
jgi:sulfur-oxidizing protein SoxZ